MRRAEKHLKEEIVFQETLEILGNIEELSNFSQKSLADFLHITKKCRTFVVRNTVNEGFLGQESDNNC
jgi:hypothetical protein